MRKSASTETITPQVGLVLETHPTHPTHHIPHSVFLSARDAIQV